MIDHISFRWGSADSQLLAGQSSKVPLIAKKARNFFDGLPCRIPLACESLAILLAAGCRFDSFIFGFSRFLVGRRGKVAAENWLHSPFPGRTSSPASWPGWRWLVDDCHLASDVSRNVSITWQQSSCSVSRHFSSDDFNTCCTCRKSFNRWATSPRRSSINDWTCRQDAALLSDAESNVFHIFKRETNSLSGSDELELL